MQIQQDKQLTQTKQDIKNNINQCSNIQQEVQKLQSELNKQTLAGIQIDDTDILLKNISQLVQKIKEHQSALKKIVKEQIKNKKNQKFENKNEIINLAGTRFNMVEALRILDEKIQISLIQAKQISNFEENYLMNCFADLQNFIKQSQEESQAIFKIVSIINYSQKDEIQENDLLAKLIDQINQTIKTRFQNKIGQFTNTQILLNNSRFIIDDMITVQKHVSKCFPKEIKIFNIFEQQYRNNFQKIIKIDIQNEKELSQKFEMVTQLIEWISIYEQQIIKVDGQPLEFSQIKSELMRYMPLFQDHMRELTTNLFQTSLDEDYFKLTIEQLERCIEEGLQIELTFGVDCFNFLSKQIDTICSKLEVNQFIEWIRQISQIFQLTLFDQEKEIICKQISQIQIQIQSYYENQNNNLDNFTKTQYNYDQQIQRDCNLIIARIVTIINLLQQCQNYSLDVLKLSLSYYSNKCEDYFIERITKIFNQDIRLKFKQFADYLIQQAIQIIIDQVSYQIAPHLFEQSISEQDFNLNLTISNQVESNILILIEKIDFYLKLVKKNLKLQNFVYLSFSKLLIQNVINLYWNQIYEEVKQEYGQEQNIIQLIYQIAISFKQELSPFNNKNKTIKVTSLFSNHNNFELLVQRIQNDQDILSKYLNNTSLISFSQSTIQSYINQFEVFVNTLQTQNSKLKDVLFPIKFAFQSDISQQIFDTIMMMRLEIPKNEKQKLQKTFYQQTNKNDQNNPIN